MASRVYARLRHKVKHTVNATAPQFILATLAEPANLHRCHAASLADVLGRLVFVWVEKRRSALYFRW